MMGLMQKQNKSSLADFVSPGCLEKLGFSFKIKACEKFNHRHMFDILRIKF
jgi:hypothetical protein